MSTTPIPPGPSAHDTEVDLLVIGSGTGMATALSAADQGLSALVVEKTAYVGGSTARSGGAFWIPANPVLTREGAHDSLERADEYLDALVADSAPEARRDAFLEHGAATVKMLERLTPMEFFWTRGYSDYHPETPGGSAVGRTCECRPFNAAVLGDDLARLRPGPMTAPVPMPVTGADYKWMNLMARRPVTALPKIARRVVQGIGGLALKRRYTAGGQAIAAGLFAGLRRAGIPVWTNTSLVELITTEGTVTGAIVEQQGHQVTIRARRGVVLAAGGFDHNAAMREQYQSPSIDGTLSLGSEGNTGDAIEAGRKLGAGLASMSEAWWFPAAAPLPGAAPQIFLAERSLPRSLLVNQDGKRFINESTDYMSFGQRLQQLERDGEPITDMWLVFDQTYRNRYVFAGTVFPRMPLPDEWYEAGIAVTADDPHALARAAGLPEDAFAQTVQRFNAMAQAGTDADFRRGDSAYDRYYGDPTITPNPNLGPVERKLYAVRTVLSDLGTCGGLLADEHGRVLREDGTVIEGLYAQGNTAGNVFGRYYPGAGATIAQGLVYGHIIAQHVAAAA